MKPIPIATAAALAFFFLAACSMSQRPESVALVGAAVIDDHDAVTHDLARALSRATAIREDAPVEDLVGRATIEHDAYVIADELEDAQELLEKNKEVPLPGDAATVSRLKGRTENELTGAIRSAKTLDEKLRNTEVSSSELAQAAGDLENAVRHTAEEHAALMNDVAEHQEIEAVAWEQLWPQHELAVRHSREMGRIKNMLLMDGKSPDWKASWRRSAEALQARLEHADEALDQVASSAVPQAKERIEEIRRLHADMQHSLADLRHQLDQDQPSYAKARRDLEALQESLTKARSEQRSMMQERNLGAYPDYDERD